MQHHCKTEHDKEIAQVKGMPREGINSRGRQAVGDLFAGVLKKPQRIEKAFGKLEALVKR